MLEQDTDKVTLLAAERHEFARGEVVRLDTPPGILARVLVPDGHRAPIPASGESRGLDRHPVHVESVRAVEVGVEPKDRVDQVHLIDGVPRYHVRLSRLPQFFRRFRVLTQDGLRAKDNHLGLTGKDARTLAREILAMSPEEFSAASRHSPMKRAKLRGLKRNAAVVLGNVGDERETGVLERALDDPEPLVRVRPFPYAGPVR